ncbi:hypothetical protein [Actinoplanes sp. NPDC049316]|uniref:hypothetical protein n=1 Tax=Actinoplanes sp. NPDC049316 TaxID=3154727 RepID=UPI0034166A7E
MRVLRTILGMLLLTAGLPALLAGGAFWAAMQHRDAGGAFSGTMQRVATSGYAVVVDDVDELLRKDAPFARFGDTRLRLTATSGDAPAFVGLAPRDRADAYLADIPRISVSAIDLGTGALPVTSKLVPGTRAPEQLPGRERFWLAAGVGAVDWNPTMLRDTRYSLIIMNPAAQPGVRLESTAAVRPGWLNQATWALLVGGTLLVMLGMIILGWPARRREVVYVVEPSQVPDLMQAIGAPLPLSRVGGGRHSATHRPRTLADCQPRSRPPALTWPPSGKSTKPSERGAAIPMPAAAPAAAPEPVAAGSAASASSPGAGSLATAAAASSPVAASSGPVSSGSAASVPASSGPALSGPASSDLASPGSASPGVASSGPSSPAPGEPLNLITPRSTPAPGAATPDPVVTRTPARRRSTAPQPTDPPIFQASAVGAWVAETAAARARETEARAAAALSASRKADQGSSASGARAAAAGPAASDAPAAAASVAESGMPAGPAPSGRSAGSVPDGYDVVVVGLSVPKGADKTDNSGAPAFVTPASAAPAPASVTPAPASVTPAPASAAPAATSASAGSAPASAVPAPASAVPAKPAVAKPAATEPVATKPAATQPTAGAVPSKQPAGAPPRPASGSDKEAAAPAVKTTPSTPAPTSPATSAASPAAASTVSAPSTTSTGSASSADSAPSGILASAHVRTDRSPTPTPLAPSASKPARPVKATPRNALFGGPSANAWAATGLTRADSGRVGTSADAAKPSTPPAAKPSTGPAAAPAAPAAPAVPPAAAVPAAPGVHAAPAVPAAKPSTAPAAAPAAPAAKPSTAPAAAPAASTAAKPAQPEVTGKPARGDTAPTPAKPMSPAPVPSSPTAPPPAPAPNPAPARPAVPAPSRPTEPAREPVPAGSAKGEAGKQTSSAPSQGPVDAVRAEKPADAPETRIAGQRTEQRGVSVQPAQTSTTVAEPASQTKAGSPPKVAEQAKPLNQQKAVEQPKPVDQQKTVEQPKPVDQQKTAERPKRPEQQKLAERPQQQAEQQKVTEQPKPADPRKAAEESGRQKVADRQEAADQPKTTATAKKGLLGSYKDEVAELLSGGKAKRRRNVTASGLPAPDPEMQEPPIKLTRPPRRGRGAGKD